MTHREEPPNFGPSFTTRILIPVIVSLITAVGAGWLASQTHTTTDVAVAKQRLDDFNDRLTKLESTVAASNTTISNMARETSMTAADVHALLTIANAAKAKP